jgi:hypothetical protein
MNDQSIGGAPPRIRRAPNLHNVRGRWYTGDMAARRRIPWSWTVPAIAVIVLTAVVGAIRYPGLPARIPAHFDIHGTVDRTVATTVLSAFLPLLFQLGLTAVLIAAAAATARDRRTATAILVLAAFLDLTLFLVATQIWRAGRGISAGVGSLVVAGIGAGLIVVVAAAVRSTARDRPPAVVSGRRPLLVPKRIGVGWSLNPRHPASWVILGAVLALLVVGAVAGSVSG